MRSGGLGPPGPARYDGCMLAANVWHWWIGIVLTVVGVGSVLGLAVQYLTKVTATKYPGRHQQRPE